MLYCTISCITCRSRPKLINKETTTISYSDNSVKMAFVAICKTNSHGNNSFLNFGMFAIKPPSYPCTTTIKDYFTIMVYGTLLHPNIWHFWQEKSVPLLNQSVVTFVFLGVVHSSGAICDVSVR